MTYRRIPGVRPWQSIHAAAAETVGANGGTGVGGSNGVRDGAIARCNACGQVFTAEEPEGIGPAKCDATATAMIAQLKYGTGVPFTRLDRMESQMGIPLPAATQYGSWWNRRPQC